MVPGLESVTLETATGRSLRLARGPGGLRAHARARRTATSASGRSPAPPAARAGVLGEGIRQALLRDPTYVPALDAAWRCASDGAGRDAPDELPRRRGRRRARRGPRIACAVEQRARAARRRPRGAQRRTHTRTHLRAAGRRPRGAGGDRAVVRRRALRGARGRGEQLPARGRDAARTGRRSRPAGPPHARASSGPRRGARSYESELRERLAGGRRTACRCSTWCCSGSAPTGTSPRCSRARPRSRGERRCAWGWRTRPSRRPSGSR